jgi:hypothetical protein
MPTLIMLQSIWAMERRRTDGFERSLEGMIVDEGVNALAIAEAATQSAKSQSTIDLATILR